MPLEDSREGNPHPPKKSRTQIKAACTNSFLLLERGDSLYKQFQSCLRKLCFHLRGWFWGVGFLDERWCVCVCFLLSVLTALEGTDLRPRATH